MAAAMQTRWRRVLAGKSRRQKGIDEIETNSGPPGDVAQVTCEHNGHPLFTGARLL